MTSFEVIEVKDPAILQRILALRVVAWKSFIKVDPDLHEWTDQFDATAQHWAILDGVAVVAAGRLSIHERLCDVPDSEVYESVLTMPLLAPIASMNRLVVHPDHRGKGLSRSLDHARIAAAERAGCGCVLGYTSSGDKRVAQLISEGFQALGISGETQRGLLKGMTGVVIYRSLGRNPIHLPSSLRSDDP